MESLVKRNIHALAEGALGHFPVLVIQGVRRAGKSTLAAQLAAGRPHTLVSMDDTESRESALSDPDTLLKPAADSLMVIDEVQRVPGLILAVKSVVDKDKQPGRFILAGSSDFMALPDIPDSLAGRAATIRLRPFSQGELAGRQEDFVARLLRGFEALECRSTWTRENYAQMAWRGGYPEVLGLEEPWRSLWIDSYLDRLTARDAQSVTEKVSAARVRAVLRLIAANQGGELVKARIAQAAGISTNSVTTCLDTLKALYLVDTVPAATVNLTKRETDRTKAVISDTSLALQLNNITVEQLASASPHGNDWFGRTLEAVVIAELLKQRDWSAERWSLSHYRDTTGLEVDAVIELAGDRVILIEVKASSSYHSGQFDSIKKLAAKLGDRFVAGIVLTTADHAWRYTDNLIGLPVAALWEAW
ncbi:MAG: ATP-binding protein [Propionibacteriaceae bacterium]|jgi:predicted AAA+ superfamily ATPase|nr:ATP-binding protein [Propionibacteriaceae bacterium]